MSNNEQDNHNTKPHVGVNAQYIKDLSFENPLAPVVPSQHGAPRVDLSLDLHVKPLEENVYEVAMRIEASANTEDKTIFLVELTYAGVFTLSNIPQAEHEPILAIHCPAILFPFAREIVSSTTQNGGFQPLMIDPIDFGMLYQKKMMEKHGASEVLN